MGATMSNAQTMPKPLQIAAAVIGNALEWYDFIVFGFFTVVIARRARDTKFLVTEAVEPTAA
jgi:hypothetical protein